MIKYDVIAIGTGVGLAFINNAVSKGLKCAIIERGKFGGTCLTRGCIPSKILLHPADIIQEVKHARKIGLNVSNINLDWKLLGERMWKKIGLSKTMEDKFTNANDFDVYKGTGEFVKNHLLKINYNDGQEPVTIFGEKIIIAVGSRSRIPNIPGLDTTGYITSETFYGDSFPKKPWKDLVIIGGGVIGVEFAHMFSSYGTNVTIVELGDKLVPKEDHEVAFHLENQFRNNDIEVLLETQALEVVKNGERKRVKIINNITQEIKYLDTDEIVIAIGVRPNLDITKIENTDVELDNFGWIKTNEYLETSVDNIWAIGDVNGLYQFRHKANYEMYKSINNILSPEKPKKKVNYNIVPWAIFTYPQIAHLGMTEHEALSKYDKILIGKLNYSQVSKGYAMGFETGDSDDGFTKLIISPEMRIIGAHIIGPHAAMLIQPYIYLMSSGCILHIDGFEDSINYNYNAEKEYIFDPLQDAMVIHPSLNEIAGWTYRTLKWVTK